MRWNTPWTVVKDIALTGTGMAVILSQVFSPHPSDVLLVTGLALTVPSVAGHAGALLTARTERPSSQHGLQSLPLPSPRSPEGGTGE